MVQRNLGYHCYSLDIDPEARSAGRSDSAKAAFTSQKGEYRSATGRQAAEAKKTRGDQAGSQDTKKLAGFKGTNTGRQVDTETRLQWKM